MATGWGSPSLPMDVRMQVWPFSRNCLCSSTVMRMSSRRLGTSSFPPEEAIDHGASAPRRATVDLAHFSRAGVAKALGQSPGLDGIGGQRVDRPAAEEEEAVADPGAEGIGDGQRD